MAYGLVQGVDLTMPGLPPQASGARVAHLSDLHIRRRRPRTRLMDRIAVQLTALRLDLLVLTGDYMTRPGDEPAAIDGLRRIVERVRPRWGCVGVFGNHDSPEFIAEAVALPVTWLQNDVHAIDAAAIQVLGLGWPGDTVAMARAMAAAAQSSPHVFRLALCHTPSAFPALADLNVPLLLAGHTHGGQIRLPTGRALRNNTDLPLHLSSGILRHRHSLAAVSRGIGETTIPLRMFCSPHIPMYTLRHGPMPGQAAATIIRIHHW